jgi:hypothetical protein
MRAAMKLRAKGDDAGAATLLRAILQDEPRLPEPRLELAHLAALRDDWEEAEGHARLAVAALRQGGQWTELGAEVLLSFALNLLGEYGLPRWRMTSPASVSEGPLSPERSGYRPGPVLDPQGPTFTVIGTDIETWAGDSLDFYHQGEVVWSIDRLKFGLQERQVYFADVILLSQRP